MLSLNQMSTSELTMRMPLVTAPQISDPVMHARLDLHPGLRLGAPPFSG